MEIALFIDGMIIVLTVPLGVIFLIDVVGRK
jgi:hypothetical protein